MAEMLTLSRGEYDRRPELRSSKFKTFIESPQKYEELELGVVDENQTDPMRRGVLLHQFVLENKKQEGVDYLVWRKVKKGAEWIEFLEECKERDIPYAIQYGKTDDIALIKQQSAAILKNREAVRLIESTAVREKAIVWEQDGVQCKALLDMLCEDGSIVDIKSAADTRAKKFFWAMEDFGYHLSAVFYELARDAYWSSDRVYPFKWIVVSNTGWIHCKVYELQQEVREVARMQVRSALQHYKHCLESGEWIDPELQKSHTLFATQYWLENNGIDLIGSEI